MTRAGLWWRLLESCVVIGGVLLLGGGALRAVAIFSVFEPFTTELRAEVSAAERLQSYRIAVEGTPYVWAGGVLFFLGVMGSALLRWRHLRVYGWLFMGLTLAVLACAAELWLTFAYDIPLVRLFATGTPAVEQVERYVLERVRHGGVVGTLAALAEWTILLFFVWRPLERHSCGQSTS